VNRDKELAHHVSDVYPYYQKTINALLVAGDQIQLLISYSSANLDQSGLPLTETLLSLEPNDTHPNGVLLQQVKQRMATELTVWARNKGLLQPNESIRVILAVLNPSRIQSEPLMN
jgi:hypothetical protein